MSDLLNNPAAQAALIPFVVALAIGFALANTRFLALAPLLPPVIVLGLATGLALEPLTSVKKLLISVVAVTVAGLALEASGAAPRRPAIAALAVATGALALWVIVRVLAQMEPAALWAAGAFLIVAAIVASALAAGAASSLRGAVVGAALGWGSGVLALLGASALLAQIGLAAGTACAAVALVQMLRGRESPLGWTLVLPAAATAALVAVLASATGELRWYCLLPLPLAPLAAWWLPLGTTRPPWQRAFILGIAAIVPVLAAVALAWWSAQAGAGA